MAELKTTTRYLDATLLEHSLLRNARLRTPYGMQEGVPAYTTETEGMMDWLQCIRQSDEGRMT